MHDINQPIFQVSVIIPTFNRAHLIGRAIKSVLRQTYQEFELIIVDDASSDNTQSVIEAFNDPRIHYICHKMNQGGSASRNSGIRKSSGSYIAFLDSDDEWLPNKLELQVKQINQPNRRVSVLYTGFTYIDYKSNRIIKTQKPIYRGEILEELLIKNWIGTCSTPLIKRECFDEIGLFDERLPSCQDWDLWIRLAQKYEFDFIKDSLVRYYCHDDSITANRNATFHGREILHDKIIPLLQSRRKVHSQYHYTSGAEYCYYGNIKKGRQELSCSLRIYRLNIYSFCLLMISFLGQSLFRRIWDFRQNL